jgi:hypothetical protein
MASVVDPEFPLEPAAPEILDGRIWVDGCFDFFHHGESREKDGEMDKQRNVRSSAQHLEERAGKASPTHNLELSPLFILSPRC